MSNHHAVVDVMRQLAATSQEADRYVGVIAIKDKHIEALVNALQEARLQIEYMQSKFEPTGSGNAVLSRVRDALTLTSAQRGIES